MNTTDWGVIVMDNTFKSIDLVWEDGSVRFRLKVTDRLVAIRLRRNEKGEWLEPHSGGGVQVIANPPITRQV